MTGTGTSLTTTTMAQPGPVSVPLSRTASVQQLFHSLANAFSHSTSKQSAVRLYHSVLPYNHRASSFSLSLSFQYYCYLLRSLGHYHWANAIQMIVNELESREEVMLSVGDRVQCYQFNECQSIITLLLLLAHEGSDGDDDDKEGSGNWNEIDSIVLARLQQCYEARRTNDDRDDMLDDGIVLPRDIEDISRSEEFIEGKCDESLKPSSAMLMDAPTSLIPRYAHGLVAASQAQYSEARARPFPSYERADPEWSLLRCVLDQPLSPAVEQHTTDADADNPFAAAMPIFDTTAFSLPLSDHQPFEFSFSVDDNVNSSIVTTRASSIASSPSSANQSVMCSDWPFHQSQSTLDKRASQFIRAWRQHRRREEAKSSSMKDSGALNVWETVATTTVDHTGTSCVSDANTSSIADSTDNRRFVSLIDNSALFTQLYQQSRVHVFRPLTIANISSERRQFHSSVLVLQCIPSHHYHYDCHTRSFVINESDSDNGPASHRSMMAYFAQCATMLHRIELLAQHIAHNHNATGIDKSLSSALLVYNRSCQSSIDSRVLSLSGQSMVELFAQLQPSMRGLQWFYCSLLQSPFTNTANGGDNPSSLPSGVSLLDYLYDLSLAHVPCSPHSPMMIKLFHSAIQPLLRVLYHCLTVNDCDDSQSLSLPVFLSEHRAMIAEAISVLQLIGKFRNSQSFIDCCREESDGEGVPLIGYSIRDVVHLRALHQSARQRQESRLRTLEERMESERTAQQEMLVEDRRGRQRAAAMANDRRRAEQQAEAAAESSRRASQIAYARELAQQVEEKNRAIENAKLAQQIDRERTIEERKREQLVIEAEKARLASMIEAVKAKQSENERIHRDWQQRRHQLNNARQRLLEESINQWQSEPPNAGLIDESTGAASDAESMDEFVHEDDHEDSDVLSDEGMSFSGNSTGPSAGSSRDSSPRVRHSRRPPSLRVASSHPTRVRSAFDYNSPRAATVSQQPTFFSSSPKLFLFNDDDAANDIEAEMGKLEDSIFYIPSPLEGQNANVASGSVSASPLTAASSEPPSAARSYRDYPSPTAGHAYSSTEISPRGDNAGSARRHRHFTFDDLPSPRSGAQSAVNSEAASPRHSRQSSADSNIHVKLEAFGSSNASPSSSELPLSDSSPQIVTIHVVDYERESNSAFVSSQTARLQSRERNTRSQVFGDDSSGSASVERRSESEALMRNRDRYKHSDIFGYDSDTDSKHQAAKVDRALSHATPVVSAPVAGTHAVAAAAPQSLTASEVKLPQSDTSYTISAPMVTAAVNSNEPESKDSPPIDIHSLNQSMLLCESVTQTLGDWLVHQCATIHKLSLAYAFRAIHWRHHLSLLRDFALCQRVDVIDTFANMLFGDSDSEGVQWDAVWQEALTLHSLDGSDVSQLTSVISDNDVAHLQSSNLTNIQLFHFHDSLRFQYNVSDDSGLSLLLTPQYCQQYALIFSFLLRLSRVERALHSVFVWGQRQFTQIHQQRSAQQKLLSKLSLNKQSAKVARRSVDDFSLTSPSQSVSLLSPAKSRDDDFRLSQQSAINVSQSIIATMRVNDRRLALLMTVRHQCSILLHALKYYIHSEIIDRHYQSLLSSLSTSQSITELASEHSQYLRSILSHCFLIGIHSHGLAQALESLFLSVIQFSDALVAVSLNNVSVSEMVWGDIVDHSQSVAAHCKFLHRCLSKLTAANSQSSLLTVTMESTRLAETLLSLIDFNRYYEQQRRKELTSSLFPFLAATATVAR